MSANYTIIDVNPVEYSSSRGCSSASGHAQAHGQAHASSQSAHYQQPSWQTASYSRGEANPYGRERFGYGSAYTRFGDRTVVMKPAGSLLSGLAQIAVGAGLVLIGIPMLILPGPGLLSIVGGMALSANGMRKLLG